VKLISKGGIKEWDDWFDWKWRWECNESYIDIDFSLLEPESLFWGGSMLKPHCTFAELVSFWNDVDAKLAVVSLHDGDCKLLKHSFFEKYAIPRLEEAL
jgi:hypothetical protein